MIPQRTILFCRVFLWSLSHKQYFEVQRNLAIANISRDIQIRGQFHLCSTGSFYVPRSLKPKKGWQLDYLFYAFGICVHKNSSLNIDEIYTRSAVQYYFIGSDRGKRPFLQIWQKEKGANLRYILEPPCFFHRGQQILLWKIAVATSLFWLLIKPGRFNILFKENNNLHHGCNNNSVFFECQLYVSIISYFLILNVTIIQ